jgi:hypothetical protein
MTPLAPSPPPGAGHAYDARRRPLPGVPDGQKGRATPDGPVCAASGSPANKWAAPKAAPAAVTSGGTMEPTRGGPNAMVRRGGGERCVLSVERANWPQPPPQRAPFPRIIMLSRAASSLVAAAAAGRGGARAFAALPAVADESPFLRFATPAPANADLSGALAGLPETKVRQKRRGEGWVRRCAPPSAAAARAGARDGRRLPLRAVAAAARRAPHSAEGRTPASLLVLAPRPPRARRSPPPRHPRSPSCPTACAWRPRPTPTPPPPRWACGSTPARATRRRLPTGRPTSWSTWRSRARR